MKIETSPEDHSSTFMQKMKFAYWSVGILAILNLGVFISSFIGSSPEDTHMVYLHYNLALAIGYGLVFVFGRHSKSTICLGLAVFLFLIGLVVSRDISESLTGMMVRVWLWAKWILILPIVLALMTSIKKVQKHNRTAK